MKIGYRRTSTTDQKFDRQLDGITVDKWFSETATARHADRPQLKAMIDFAREGDEVIVHSIDRLARSLPDLRQLVDGFTSRGITVTFVKENLSFKADVSDPFSKLMLQLLGAVAEFEREIITERSREGSVIARQKAEAAGKPWGRPRALTDKQVQTIRVRVLAGESVLSVARDLGVGKNSAYRALKA